MSSKTWGILRRLEPEERTGRRWGFTLFYSYLFYVLKNKADHKLLRGIMESGVASVVPLVHNCHHLLLLCLRSAARPPQSRPVTITSLCSQTASTPAGLWASPCTAPPCRSLILLLWLQPIQTYSRRRRRRTQLQSQAGRHHWVGGRRGRRRSTLRTHQWTHGLHLSLLSTVVWTRCCAPPKPWTLWRSPLKWCHHRCCPLTLCCPHRPSTHPG